MWGVFYPALGKGLGNSHFCCFLPCGGTATGVTPGLFGPVFLSPGSGEVT